MGLALALAAEWLGWVLFGPKVSKTINDSHALFRVAGKDAGVASALIIKVSKCLEAFDPLLSPAAKISTCSMSESGVKPHMIDSASISMHRCLNPATVSPWVWFMLRCS